MENTVLISFTLPAPLFWGLVTLACLSAACWLIYLTLPEAQAKPGPVQNLQERFGIKGIHPVALMTVIALWSGLALILAVGLFGLIYDMLATTESHEDRLHLIRIAGLTTVLGAVIALPMTLIRLRLTDQANQTTEQGQITDRISKAVEGLGSEKMVKRQRRNKSGNPLFHEKEDGELDIKMPIMEELSQPNLEVRLGAIYALERISQDSPRDHLQIMEVLCAYVRQNSPQSNLDATVDLKKRATQKRATPRIDIQAILTVLGRRSTDLKALEASRKFRLDLSYTNLDGANFTHGDFTAVNLSNSRLERAIFDHANFSGARLQRCLLNSLSIRRTNLKGARLDFAHMSIGPPTPWSSLSLAAAIEGINLTGADLSGLFTLGNSQEVATTFGTKDTKLSDQAARGRPDNGDLDNYHTFKDGSDEEKLSVRFERLSALVVKSGFQNWSAFPSDDLSTGYLYDQFRTKLGLTGWPFTN